MIRSVGIAGVGMSGGSPPRDRLEVLVAEVAAGSAAAMDALYRETARRVFGLVVRLVGDRGIAEEVTLDVFTQVWQEARDFDAVRGSALAWLLMLARSRAIDARRSRDRKTRLDETIEAANGIADRAPGPDAAVQDGDLARRVQRAMARLSPEQRESIEAAFFRGMSHAEVAGALDTPLGTVKTRIRTGLALLRRELGAAEGAA